MTPEVADEAAQALNVGLITASVSLVNGERLEIVCDRLEPTPEGDLLLIAPTGLVVAAVARGQWVSFETQQPELLHCRPAL